MTVVEGPSTGAKLLIRPDAAPQGTLGDPELDRVVARDAGGELDAGASGLRRYGCRGEARQDEVTVFVESFVPPPRLLVFGAVDFTAALVRVAKVLGHHVTVCDARAVFATPRRFPLADEVVVDRPDRFLGGMGADLTPRDAICVLTHDHKFDVPAILAALHTDVGYLGAMGSRRTHEERTDPAPGGRRVGGRPGPGARSDRPRPRRPHAGGDGGGDLRRDHRVAHRPRRRPPAARHGGPDPWPPVTPT